MPTKVRDYDAAGIAVSYDVGRCIHAAECVHGLPRVFDPKRRVWIDATQAEPAEIAAVVGRCPTGALHFSRKDGGPGEPVPQRNEVRVVPDGPLYLRGELEIHTPTGIVHETRAALCRCGASANKPFCDNSHRKSGFRDATAAQRTDDAATPAPGVLRVRPRRDGPCVVEGAVTLVDEGGEPVARLAPRAALCRCGHSSHKPFCDGSHEQAGFSAS